MTRRTTAAVVLGVWVAALGWLARREFLVPAPPPLARAALRLPPGANYYALSLDGRQVGFASLTVDTVPDTLRVVDLLVLDLPVLATRRPTEVMTEAVLSRALALRQFTSAIRTGASRYAARGTIAGDTLTIELERATGRDTLTMALAGPVVLPGLLPLTVAFGGALEVGRSGTLRQFDPATLTLRQVTYRVVAESTFVFPDSAAFDTVTGRFLPARLDTAHAWAVRHDGAGGAGATTWIDAVGNVVRAGTDAGFTVERQAFELAYANFRDHPDTAFPARRGGVVRQTAIAAGASLVPSNVSRLAVRLGGVPLGNYALEGGWQRLLGDTLVVERARPGDRRGRWRLGQVPDSLAPWLAAGPMVQSDDPRLAARARLIIRDTRRQHTAAERLVDWVYREIAKEVRGGVPSALDVLAQRRGDCNEHTVLYVALARAVGLPARAVAGLVYLEGQFFYHAWPEVWLADTWVAVDPTLGQYPADAGHLRFRVNGLARQLDLVRLLGRVTIDIVDREG